MKANKNNKCFLKMYPVLMAINATTLFTLAVVLAVIRSMPSRQGVDWWIVAAVAQAASYLLTLHFSGGQASSVDEGLYMALKVIAHFGLCLGILQFFEKKTSLLIRLLLAMSTVTLASGLSVMGYSDIALYTVVAYNASNMLYTSFVLFRDKKEYIGIKTVALICMLIGIHWIDFPLLRHVKAFAPYGFAIGLLLAATLFIVLTVCALLQFKQVTKESEKKAIRESRTDALTGAYNRSYLEALFEKYQKASDRKKRPFALVFIDLDGFKIINDTYGHEAGDLILQVISKRLKNFLGEKGSVLRLGGDEFVIFSDFRAAPQKKNIRILAERILEVIEQPIMSNVTNYQVSGSLGVCSYPENGCQRDTLLSMADKLMYVAKKTPGMNIKYADQLFEQVRVMQMEKDSEAMTVF